MRILLQFPEGMKPKAIEYAQGYLREGHEVIISSGPAYGACDVPVHEAKMLGCNKIVHFGHCRFHKVEGIDVEYVPEFYNVDIGPVMGKVIGEIAGHKRVGLITNLSHARQVNEIKGVLEGAGKTVVTAKGSERCPYEGQILGCDTTALNSIKNDVDCIVYFGAGAFHALAPATAQKGELPPVLWADPFTREVKWISDDIELMRRRRRAALMKALGARSYGVLVSAKGGQFALGLAESIVANLRKRGRDAFIIAGDTFDFTSLGNFTGVDAFINTACPRIADDQNKLNIPIVNASDFAEHINDL